MNRKPGDQGFRDVPVHRMAAGPICADDCPCRGTPKERRAERRRAYVEAKSLNSSRRQGDFSNDD